MKGRKFLISLFVVVIVVISFVISVVINMMVVVIAVVVVVMIKSRPNLKWRSIISFRSNQRTIGGHRGVEFDQRSG